MAVSIVVPPTNNLKAFAALEGSAGKIPYFTSPTTMGLLGGADLAPIAGIFSTISTASGATISDDITLIRVDRYTSGGPLITAYYREVADTGTLLPSQFRSNGNTRRWQLAEPVLRPEMFGAFSDGATDDTVALNSWMGSLGNGVNGLAWGSYLISERMILNGKSDFIIGGGARFKIADGTPVGESYSALLVQNCEDFLIEDLFIDGNRANRTPAEASGHQVRVIGANRNGIFRRVRSYNATTDGWYVRAQTPGDANTYPVDVVWEDCEAINAYRNGMSIIGGTRLKVLGGRYCDTTGTLPESGIDLEPNTSDTLGVIDMVIENVEVSNNNGPGLTVTGNVGFGLTKGLVVRGLRGRNNRGVGGASGYGALIHLSTSENTSLFNIHADDHPNFAPATSRGLIHLDSTAAGVTLDGFTVSSMTTASANAWCVRSDNATCEIYNVSLRNLACGGVLTSMTGGVLSNINVVNSTATGIAIQIGGSGTVARGLTVRNHAGTYSIYVSATLIQASDFRAVDGVSTVAQIRFEAGATNASIRGMSVHQTLAVPSGAALRIDAAPDELFNIRATKTSGASGSWTTSNLITATAGLFAPTKMAGTTPDLLGTTFVYDPASIAAGGNTTRLVNIPGASLLDTVTVTPPYDLQGITLSSTRMTSNGQATLVLFNPTAGAIDLASGTWSMRVVKA
jgi:hypothetical protein